MPNSIFALVSLLFLLCYFPALAQASIQGNWQGQHVCGGISYALTLSVYAGDQTNIAARATVQPSTGTIATEFEMTGSIDSNGLYQLQPTRQLNRVPGFRPAGYRGRLSPGSQNATASVIFPGCTEFFLQQTSKGVEVVQQVPPTGRWGRRDDRRQQ